MYVKDGFDSAGNWKRLAAAAFALTKHWDLKSNLERQSIVGQTEFVKLLWLLSELLFKLCFLQKFQKISYMIMYIIQTI